MKRTLCLVLIATLCLGLLSGCATIPGLSGSADILSIKPLTLEEVAGSRLVATTTEEKESQIYKYISDRIVVDGSKLIAVNTDDEKNITALLANINNQLAGRGGTALTEEYANYLLLEFAKTPYEWVQSSKDIVGFDPAARLYFVDVTYTTNKTYKSVVPDSKITMGNPEVDSLRQKRYSDYMSMMNYQTKGNSDKAANARINFEKAWGKLEDIFEEQQGVSLYTRTYNKGSETGGIGKLTYSNLVNSSKLALPATMTVRYVLRYRLNLGEELDLMVEALYLKNYAIADAEKVVSSYKLSDTASLEVLKPFIDNLILSYNKCVEESNHVGLYQLFYDYSTVDKYYDEIQNYTYNSIGGYTYEILQRSGYNVAVKVNRVNQIRAKGAEMSLPTYDETLIFNLVLCPDDKIRIDNVYLISSTLIGEPLSVIRNVTGISDIIQYSNAAFSSANKTAVENLIKSFSEVVTNADITSAAFLKCVDLGVSQNVLNRMVDTISSVKANRKVTYIVSWNTKTNVYASVTVREVFECDSGNFDTEAVIDMVNRNNTWKVVNYTRTVNIKAAKTTLNTDTAFCITERTSGGANTPVGEITKPETKVEEPVITQPVEVEDPIDNSDSISNADADAEKDPEVTGDAVGSEETPIPEEGIEDSTTP